MKYKIDSNTLLPPSHRGSGIRTNNQLSIIETLRDMPPSLTHSFLVPLKKRTLKSVRSSINGAIASLRKQHPERKFATRYIREEKGVRVWRVV